MPHPPRVPWKTRPGAASSGRSPSSVGQHVHSRIDAAELPVTHKTMRHGSPYTLVLNKIDALFVREQEARIRDETDLEWLAAQWALNA